MERVLSIIVPAYNVEKYLKKTLSSCELSEKEEQKKYEVIIVNDGSVDNTHFIAQEYVKRYSDTETFKLIDKDNGGYGSTINVGLKAACGKYVKILDGDDWYNTMALKELICLLDITNSDAVLTDYTSVDDCTGECKLCQYDLKQKKVLKMENCQILPKDFNMHGVCYKADILRKHNVRITEHCFYTDTEFLLYPLPFISTICYYALNLYQYRVGREGQSISPSGMIAHISDQEILLEKMNCHFDKEISQRNRNLIDARIAIVYDAYIRALLSSRCCIANYKKLKTFISTVKVLYPQRYRYIVNRKVRLLEKSNFFVYLMCCEWHRKIERKR